MSDPHLLPGLRSFNGALILQDMEDGRFFDVIERVRYFVGDKGSNKWHDIQAGFRTDLLSIPIFRSLGRGNAAGALHDSLYSRPFLTVLNSVTGHVKVERISRARCDRIFREALEVRGVTWFKRWRYYAAVRAFGWRESAWGKYRTQEAKRELYWQRTTST